MMEEDRFSFLYFLIERYDLNNQQSKINLKHIEMGLDILNSYFFQLVNDIVNLQNNNRKEELEELCTCFKMSVFLISFALQNSVLKKSKSLMDDVDKQGQLEIVKKSKKSHNSTNNEYDEKKIIDLQSQCLSSLLRSLIDIDFSDLWSGKAIDQEIYKYYLDTCLRMFESKSLMKEQNSSESESYVLRNSIYDIILNIMKKLYVNISENEEMKIKTKEKLLSYLIERIRDKHAYCRSQVLANLAECCELDLVPINILKIILDEAIERTKDTGAIVRKKALALIQKIIDYYRYIFTQNKKFLTQRDIKREIKMAFEQQNEEDGKINLIEQDIQKLQVEIYQNTQEQGDNFDQEQRLQELHTEREEIAKKIISIRLKIERLGEYKMFIGVVDILVPNLVQLLGSKNSSDVLETIRLLTQLKRFNIESAQEGMRKMLVLVFSNEKAIKDEVLNTYHSLYMDPNNFKSMRIADNLVGLIKDANLTEEKSFEELLLSIIDFPDKKRIINADMFKECLKIFNNTFTRLYDLKDLDQEGSENLSYNAKSLKQNLRASIKIIRIAQIKNSKIVQKEQLLSFLQNIARFIQLKGQVDWVIVKEICLITSQAHNQQHQQIINKIMKSLILLLIKNHGTKDNEWFNASEEIIKLSFRISNNPEGIQKCLLNKLSEFMEKQQSRDGVLNDEVSKSASPKKEDLEAIDIEQNIQENDNVIEENLDIEESAEIQTQQDFNNEIEIYENKIAQSIFVASTSALQFLLHLDNIEDFINKIRHEIEMRETKKQEKKSVKKGKDQNMEEEVEEEDELDKVHGGTEAEYEARVKELQKIGESLLDDSQIFKFYKKLVENMVLDLFNSLKKKQMESRNKIVDRVAILSLIKFMCVSYKFCQQNIDILFQLIDPKSEFANLIDSGIKNNILIGIGDLYRRYTNLLEPYLHLVYQTLQDKDPHVRKTSLMVVSHLVLIDKLKVKAEVSNIAMLIEDDHIPIQNQVKLFFYELNKKDNKQIYNFLPDIITNLSQKNVNEEVFTNFSKNVLSAVIKDNPNEAMIDKMIQRFEITSTGQEWRNISTTLTLFSYSEKSVKRLLEKFEVFRVKLKDEKILENFQSIIKKTKLFGTKTPELKALIEEFEAKVNNYKKETFDDVKYRKVKNSRKADATKQQKGQVKGKSNRRSTRRRQYDEEEEEELMEIEDIDGDDFQIQNSSKRGNQAAQVQRSVRNRNNIKKMADDSSEEEFY